MDEKRLYPYKILTWKIDKTVAAPVLGIDVRQKWPYAPYYQMTTSLWYAARDIVLFLCLAALTLLILGESPQLERLALLAGLFTLPYWLLMAGGVPLPASVLPAQFAEVQVKALPALAIVPLLLALFVLRGHSRTATELAPYALRGHSRTATALVLLLMALLMLGHPLLQLLPEEPKRKSIESAAQWGLVGYACALALFAVLRGFFRRWLAARRAKTPPGETGDTGGGDVQNQL